MTLKIEVGKKGYIIIPKTVRDLLEIKEGDILILRVEDGKIVLEPERKVSFDDLKKKMEEHSAKISYANKAKLGDLINVSLEEEFDN
ncbi:AbrB/MazE/SpoVT family DNA-binding domain-containing protein [Saccharolobus solfataricus]|uniref:AbrB/MazE/SpoVT family DNA-binding domain-containing protein n=2 Tax=Saccharolobus solfataricus TaxID=2287 RepID=A0A0E3K976_SACSO|nr:AbrB/MazE/SpoVT family DNA-binding domain-containing protein [Saccharolobus solfataricus]AKA74687.1 AbrB/MazE/SpoVT family DNA-binding domain-containing protein [Saccharolobus solfataricus]AKA77381.1 AbrB/MazE/SpoVT family DNA-binding domain-containing protein [Saccharolobus solfataricus]AKA80072.1 AbrB/MazE/SpoVT family DNA-binding domain-containing protein [Saccharolobus solfataricus]AZF69151.1 AbrB/MazE/SpoVT family DNA-binding domain-containing protein [Saccharolobus solfataricus]AZF717